VDRRLALGRVISLVSLAQDAAGSTHDEGGDPPGSWGPVKSVSAATIPPPVTTTREYEISTFPGGEALGLSEWDIHMAETSIACARICRRPEGNGPTRHPIRPC
jgi:hypothetical protein